MASLRLKSVQYHLGVIRDLGFVGGRRRRRGVEGFVNYAPQTYGSSSPRLVVVNKKNARTDLDGSSSSASGASCSSSSVFEDDGDHHNWSKLGSLGAMINRERDRDVVIDDGKLDTWVKESVVEILNNLEEAPFLVHIYTDSEEGSGSAGSASSSGKTRLVKEKATAESWPSIKGRWGGNDPTPTGIILVEEMKNSEESVSETSCSSSSSTRVWGILIQGKGVSCPACYILKTCRVRSVLGCCTHFCLMRVGCFFESVDIQLKNLWLV
ncbi:OLC1v1018504C1 [Oldenlandia corymbosa var. corymbosa]|uniref:OLC1v1018504C1 n=1 Tax=Oldenlandia corymbosa var. corymbosa TaxID=529605 RepID=A0AAV1EBY9_OLDCO|nr:OLC1v1018504C1 [Oldenlandia corymbosa var. corymbosa]